MVGSLGADSAKLNAQTGLGNTSNQDEIHGSSFDQELANSQNSANSTVFPKERVGPNGELLPPISSEEKTVLSGAERGLTAPLQEIDLAALAGQLVNPMTEEQATEIARLQAIANQKLIGEEPNSEIFSISHEQQFQDFKDGMNLVQGDQYRHQMNTEFVHEPDLQAVAENYQLPIATYGTVHTTEVHDPEAPPFVNQISTNPEVGKQDLDIAMMKEKNHLMDRSELLPPPALKLDDPRNKIVEDPNRLPISIEEQIALARAERLNAADSEFATQRLNDSRNKVESLIISKKTNESRKIATSVRATKSTARTLSCYYQFQYG